jgi:hypothetical protein
MRILGVLLVIIGVIAFAVPSITFFSHDRVVDTGFFHVDVQRPHTIIFNPAVGIVCLIAGAVLLLTGRRSEA